MFTRTALIGRPRLRQSSRYAACAVRFISARAAIIRYRRRRRMQTAKRARFGLASSTCLALNKPLRVVGSYGRLALLGRKPKSASRTSPTTSAVLSRWSEWPPHDGDVCPARIKRGADRVNATASAENQQGKRASCHSGGISNNKIVIVRGALKTHFLIRDWTANHQTAPLICTPG